MPRDINGIFKINSTFFELKIKNMQLWSSIKNDAFTLLVQHIFSEGLTFQSTFTSASMPQNLKMYFRSTQQLYKYVAQSPETRLDINQRGIVTLFKSQDGLILPQDIQFFLEKVHYNSTVKMEIELKKTRQYLRSMQITLNKQNESLNRIKRLNHVLIKQNKKLREKCNKAPKRLNFKRNFDLTEAKSKIITQQGQQVSEVIEVADQKVVGSLMEFAQKHKIKELRQKIRSQTIFTCQQINLNLQSLLNIPPFPFLHNLRVLSLQNNKISKMRNMTQLRNLEQIYLSNNYINRIQGLQCLKFLKVLDLSWNKIQQIEKLQTNSELTKLLLNKNEIKIIENLFHLEMLQVLDLSQNIIYCIPDEIHQLKSLRFLNIEKNFMDKLSHGLVMLQKLQELKLSTFQQKKNDNKRGQSSQNEQFLGIDPTILQPLIPEKRSVKRVSRLVNLQSDENKTIVAFLQSNNVKINGTLDYLYYSLEEISSENSQKESKKEKEKLKPQQYEKQSDQEGRKGDSFQFVDFHHHQRIIEIDVQENYNKNNLNPEQSCLQIKHNSGQKDPSSKIHGQKRIITSKFIELEENDYEDQQSNESRENEGQQVGDNSFLYYPTAKYTNHSHLLESVQISEVQQSGLDHYQDFQIKIDKNEQNNFKNAKITKKLIKNYKSYVQIDEQDQKKIKNISMQINSNKESDGDVLEIIEEQKFYSIEETPISQKYEPKKQYKTIDIFD